MRPSIHSLQLRTQAVGANNRRQLALYRRVVLLVMYYHTAHFNITVPSSASPARGSVSPSRRVVVLGRIEAAPPVLALASVRATMRAAHTRTAVAADGDEARGTATAPSAAWAVA